MKEYLKYASYLFISITIAYICATLRSCGDVEQTSAVVVTPADTAFSPVVWRNYRPASTPFEKPIKPPVKLPRNVREKDVKSVLIVVKQRTTTKDTTAIITTKDGLVHIDKQQGMVHSVELITYMSPILDFGFYILAGLSLSNNLSPVVAICPLQICGAIQIPILAADLYGIAAGGAYRWKNISLGIVEHFPFTAGRSTKIIIAYNF